MTEKSEDRDQQIAALRDKIATLETTCNDEAQPPVVRDILRNELEKAQQELARIIGADSEQLSSKDAVTTNQGKVELHDSEASGVNAGVISQSIINQFFNGKPPNNGEQLLQDYLQALMQDCNRLRLERMTEKRQTGDDQATTPKLKLQDVYTSLTTDGPDIPTCRERTRTRAYVQKLIKRIQSRSQDKTADNCDPSEVRYLIWEVTDESEKGWQELSAYSRFLGSASGQPDDLLTIQIVRRTLALDAIKQHQRLVLLGEPGSGKSTVLRYLAVLLAQKLLSMPTAIPGWEQVESLPVPVLCPLGKVAEALTKTEDADKALWHALEQSLDGSHHLRAGLLKDAMKRGAVLLLCDGLDELPLTSTSNSQIKPRRDIAQALRRLANDIPSLRIVLTSRVKPYHAASDWQMPREEDWETRTIQPLAFGQIRTFIYSWYKAVSEPSQTEDLDDRAQHLIGELQHNERVGRLVESPLLLTMLTILHYNRDAIPRERVEVYHECVQLLLERWEPVRSSADPDEQRKLLARLGNIPGLNLDLLRGVLHELAFLAHDQPPADDGRGLIDGPVLNWKMLEFFDDFECDNPKEKLDIFREVLEVDAGLLQTPDHDRYAFPHLTFQEYLTACYLVEQADANEPDMCTLAYERWSGPDSERWRETLLLMMGQLPKIQINKVRYNGLPWLHQLIAPKLHGQHKPTRQRQRDILLAALSYEEAGIREALKIKDKEGKHTFEKQLRKSICQVLHKPHQDVMLEDRIAMAKVLGDIGDPRFPATLKEWRRETFPATFGKTKGYWCYIPAGTYRIGGWAEENEEDTPAADIALPEYWIACFLITVAQFRPFVDVGYNDEAQRWWTPQGWQWKQQIERTEPREWGSATWGGPNQPVIGVTWYEAMAFANWLNEQLIDALPKGYRLHLPTEAEWEVAAAYDGTDQRRTYPWGETAPTWEHAVHNESGLGQTAPVGCCAKGQAACGALDMAGNVEEWTASEHTSYPLKSDQVVAEEAKNLLVSIRGGAWRDLGEHMHCKVRRQFHPDIVGHIRGFRVVVARRRETA